MPHAPKRSHLSCWIDADLHASMKEKFGHLKSGVSGFVEEACEAAMEPAFKILPTGDIDKPRKINWPKLLKAKR